MNIGKGAIVAAGEVVNKDVESNTIVGGIPAKKLKIESSCKVTSLVDLPEKMNSDAFYNK